MVFLVESAVSISAHNVYICISNVKCRMRVVFFPFGSCNKMNILLKVL